MKDHRIEQLAEILINYSVDLKPGENLLIDIVGSETMLVKKYT
jgi:aminopeptidase